MKKPKLLQPTHLLNRLLRGPSLTPHGNFWDAYRCLRNGEDDKAKYLLEAEHNKADECQSPRTRQLDALAHALPLDYEALSWVELLAAAGLEPALRQLHAAGKIDAIHVVHLDSELSPRPFPNPDLKISTVDQLSLLALYDLEQRVLKNHDTRCPRLDPWLSERRQRAEHYFSVIEVTQSMRTT